MMKDFDIQQVDYLREKAGITYEESIALLERFDGDLARCIIDLERNGRLKPQGSEGTHANGNTYAGGYGGEAGRGNQQPKNRPAFVLDGEGVKSFLFARVLVRKDDTVISNLTVLFMLFVLIFAPWVMVVAVAAAFVTGCKVKWVKANRATMPANFQDFVDHAGENIRRTAGSVVAAVKQEPEAQGQATQQAPQGQAAQGQPARQQSGDPHRNDEGGMNG